MHRALTQLHEQRRLPIPVRQYHKHTKAPEVRQILGAMWDQAFKFGFVRNPWDLMVSSYHWWLSYAGAFASLAPQVSRIRKMGSFRAFLESDFGQTMINEQGGRDLSEWIAEGDKVIVDFVGRYENLDRDWEHVCERLKVAPIPLSRENRVPRADYRSFYDETSRELVAQRFVKSIELFGYEF
ncbi:MAG: hypothetical protein QOI04_2123 [Verrucomicrobiota bacterium]|jgi:hypothetical protein